MSQNTPYITLLQVLESFANSHLQVRRFKSDFLEQMGNFGTETEQYPILYVVPENANFFNELHTDLTSFSLRIYCVDVIQKDRANINFILNNTSQILNDLHKWLKNAKIPGIDVLSISTIFPINNYLLDYVGGWFMTITFEVESYSYCEIPFSVPPVVPQNVMDIVYNPFQGPTGPTGATGPSYSPEVGVMYLKNNATPTPIPNINDRAVVLGTIQTGILDNFIKDPTTNSLKYVGTGGRFHIMVTFNFYEGNQKTCGFYIGHNTNDTTPLDPNADRVSESEIYANSSNPSTQPIAASIQTVLNLNTDDRVFFIVQNKDAATAITVEFMKFIVTSC